MTNPLDKDGMLRWPRLGYLIIGALLGAIFMEVMRQAGF
jgi:hypothetical protein